MAYEAKSTAPIRQKAFLAGCYEAQEDAGSVREYLAELAELVDSLGTDVCGQMEIRIREHNPRFYIGSGKAEELSAAAAEANADVIIFDDPLGPSQQRNLEKLCKRKVIDRQEVILDIFAQRAWTKEAVLQDGRYVLVARGECRGHIATEKRGEGGFGYDPVFIPEGYSNSFAELGTDFKNTISHRAKALAELERLLG